MIDLDKLKQDIQDFLKSTPKEDVYRSLGLSFKKSTNNSMECLVSKEMAQSLKN